MKGTRGFTLIELLVVVAIIGLITATAMPTITSYFKLSLNSTAREMAETIKEAYNSAVITGNVHRVVYDLKEHQYWVEAGPPTAVLETQESRERDSRRTKTSKEEGPPPSPFKMQKSVTRKKQNLPRGVEFEDIVTQRFKEPISEGLAYSHFFPHGISERTLVHLKDDSEHHLSLVISPVLGRTDVYERQIPREEAFNEK
ncbi:MAG: type II secretion system protein GspH [Bdellovibrionales bacterium GWB1_55_8]|nr:MAG: type II secretion system protein GspH [Bdellovibrionales bacterium GWB1_55_8]